MSGPPTFVSEVETTFTTTTATLTTPELEALTGDLLVSFAACQSGVPTQTISNSGAALTWTKVKELIGNSQGTIWVHQLAGDVSAQTVSATASGGWKHGLNTSTWRDTTGTGATASASLISTAQVAITPTQDNSAIVVGVVDYNSNDGTSRVWCTVNGSPAVELLYIRSGTDYATYWGYYGDAGPSGACTVGLTAPTGVSGVILAVEIFGPDEVVLPEQTDRIKYVGAR